METLLKGPVFILTDDQAVAEGLESLFQSVKVKAISYNGSTQGVSAYRTAIKQGTPPQIVLIDASWKDKRSGFEISEEITALDFHDDTIRVILTDTELPYARMLSATSGASAILRKSQLTGLGILDEAEFLLRRKAERYADRTRVRSGGSQSGIWHFTNREMGVYGINLAVILLLVWFVARMDAQLSFLTRKVDTVEQSILSEAGTRSASFNAVNGTIKEVQGAVSQIEKR